MYDLARFTLRDMTECAAVLRTLGRGAVCLEEVADRIVRYLFAHLGVARTEECGCALVRLFKTYPYGELDEDSQHFVQNMLGRPPKSPSMKCLTLMATAGERPDWNVRSRSRRYRALPLAGTQFVAQFPMFSQLFKQFGVKMQTDLEPDSDLLMDRDEKTYNVFYVPDAVGSPFVPVQQDFVVACGIRSVLGFGGVLPSNDLFAVILFSKVSVPRETAELFKTLAVSVKLAVLPFVGKALPHKPTERSSHEQAADGAHRTGVELQWRRSQAKALEQLLGVHEQTVISDYIQRVRAEAALQKSEHRFRSLVEGARDIIAAFAKDGTITSLNPAFEDVTQWAPCEWIGKPITPLVHPDDLPTAMELVRYVVEKETALTWSLRIRTKKDEWVTGEVVGVPQVEDGAVAGVLVIARDITERRAVEEALRHSEEQLRSLVQSTSDAILTIDTEGCITFWNSGAAEMFGYSAQEVIGVPATIIIPERFREAHRHGVARARAAGQVTATGSMFELVGLRKDGTEFPLEFSLASWKAKSGLFFTGIIRDITERKRGEEALRESEERLRIALNAVHMGIWDWNITTDDITWSDNAKHIFGVSQDTWQGTYEEYLNLLHPQDRQMIMQSVTDCIEKRTEYSVEHRIIWPDQSLHWVACKGDVLRDDSGKAVRMLGTVMEITEHKRAEEALHASEERFRSLVSNIPGAVYRCACDPDWTMEFISEAIEDLCGYPSSDFYANRIRTYASVIHPDDRATVEREIFGAVNARRPFALEYRLLHADGSVRCVHEQGQGAFDSGGQVRWLDGVIFDVTERNRTKEALQETTERFSAAFGYAAIGMAIVATDGRFLQVNESLCRILGYSGQELLAMTFHAITHPDDLALNLAQRDHMLTGDVPTFHMEKRYIHKLGHIVWTLLSIALVRDSHGQPAYFISQVQDITERKRAESQLRALSQRLELIREEERARIARELHDELGVGLTCHKIDLSRLSTMMGDAIGSERRRAEDCKKGRRKLDEKIRSMMAQVDTTITAVQRIVTELRPGILDDLGLVAAIEWQTQDFQRRTGIPCLFVPNEEDRHMDPERATVIFRIFQEALTNVARHAQATAVTIRLEEQAGGLVLEVQDNGRGIPDEKIFDVHSLGLLGMRERAGLFGGSLTIKGCPGKGTAVTLCLPISGESLDARNASC